MFRILSCVFILTLFVPQIAQAQMSIAVVDIQYLLAESKAAQSIQEQLQKQRDKFLEKLSKEEQTLRNNEKTLIDQKASLPQEEFVAKRKEFEEKLIETRRMAQTQKRALDEAAAKAIQKLRLEIFKAVEGLTEENGYDLVITRQNVILGDKELDISEAVMDRLNKAISNIPIDVKSN